MKKYIKSLLVLKKNIKSLLSKKKNAKSILIVVLFVIFILLVIKMNNGIINNPKTEISSFIPTVMIDGVKLDKVENLNTPDDQGYIQKGFAFFNVDGQEAVSSVDDKGQLVLQTTPIILTAFVCNRGSSTKCQEYLNNGIIEQNKGVTGKNLSIHSKKVSLVSFEGENQQLDPNFEKTKLSSTSYLWCDGKHCFQVFSYKEFGDITEKLISSIIDNYSNKK